MSTAAQMIANQKNAQESTGPRTAAGKERSSQNAVKHGATASRVVLAFEDPAAFEGLRREFFRKFNPSGAVECLLVDDMAASHWRMMRMEKCIRAYVDRAAYEHPSQNPMTALADVMLSAPVQRLQRYENGFRRAFESSWKKLKELQRNRSRRQNSQNEAISGNPDQPSDVEYLCHGTEHPRRDPSGHPGHAHSEDAGDPR